MAPYHHFANREELLTAIADEGFGRLEAELIAGRDAAGAEASARLEALGRAYVNFAVSCPGYFRVMFHGDAKSSGPTASGLRAFHLLRDAVLACQEAGTAPAGDPGALVLAAWSAVHGFATLWADGALPFEGMQARTHGAGTRASHRSHVRRSRSRYGMRRKSRGLTARTFAPQAGGAARCARDGTALFKRPDWSSRRARGSGGEGGKDGGERL